MIRIPWTGGARGAIFFFVLALGLIINLQAALEDGRPQLRMRAADGLASSPFEPLPQANSSDEFRLHATPPGAVYEFEADTVGSQIVYSAWHRDGRFLGYRTLPKDEELTRRLDAGNRQSLRKELAGNALKEKTGGDQHIEIDVPFKVKSKTFRRIFGSGRIGLNVHGNIRVEAAYSNEKRESESASAFNQNPNDFTLTQEQQFTVVGKIGEKVSVHIDQNTERSFDFENNLSIVYTGEEEEVIESISAGNIALQLPSTKYVSFSDQSSGLFGLKVVSRLGPLRLTGIASTEKNESKQQTFTGSSSQKTNQMGPGDHVPNIFFVNEFYRDQYRIYSSNWDAVVDPDMVIEQFDLYVFDGRNEELPDLRLLDPAGNPVRDTPYNMQVYSWRDGATDLPFELDRNRGIVRLFNVDNSQDIAMAYRVRNQGSLETWFAANGVYSNQIVTGTLNAGPNDPVVVLRPQYFSPEKDPWWNLQHRGVFHLGTSDMDPTSFDMWVEQVVSGSSNRRDQDGVNLLSILYLDVLNLNGRPANDNKVDERWIDQETGNIWFPSPFPFGNRPEGLVLWTQPPGAGAVDTLGLYLAPNVMDGAGELSVTTPFNGGVTLDELYDLRPTSQDIRYTELNQAYLLSSEVEIGTEVISLGWNVTSVTVRANGKKLAEGVDYTLDEQAGLIRITNPTYTAKNQKIEVSYETPQLFQLRKKTFAGMTAELDLWKTENRTSKLGAAFIYFNEETAERKVRLGNEPIRNSVFDLNANLYFQPRIMTDWMDALPLIEADAPSKLDFTAEYAVVMPDPNPSNSPGTGDNNGVAYVDDFESSKQEIPMSIGHSLWYLSSKPEHEILGHRGWLGWQNPRDRVPSQEIWPEYQSSNREGINNDVRVLRVQYDPFHLASQAITGSDETLTGEPLIRSQGWGGMYYDFRGAYDDLSEKKFLELTVKIDGDHSGFINIDLGRISENVIVSTGSNDLQDEDSNNDGVLTLAEDIGLDGRAGADPPWPLPDELYTWSGSEEDQANELSGFDWWTGTPFDWWDLDEDGIRDPAEPWSYDDYRTPDDISQGIDKSHGWEGNSQDTEQKSPDTEDRDGDLSLDTENSYFSYRVPLNPAHPDYDSYVFSNSGSDWVFIRIPLKDSNRQVVGNASLTQIGGVRIWFSGFTQQLNFTIAEFNIVGNEWRKTIVADSDTSGYDITVLNNFDNSDFYVSPPGVVGNEDYSSGLVSREQALVVDLQDLPFGKTAWLRKQLVQPINLAEYRELKMFVHGGELDSTVFASEYNGDIEYKLRLQSAEGSYYEYSKFISAGWDPANSMRILFSEITGIEAFDEATREQEEPGKPVLLADGGQVIAVGNPAITQVRSMLIGVKNHGAAPARTQVWFNELRVSNVKKPVSRAMRADMNAEFSDVLKLSGNFEQKDADYHTVKERAARSGATFKRIVSGSMNTDLGRLLPPSMGVRASLGLTANRNFEIPKYFPNDDREVVIGEHPAWIERDTRGRSASLGLSKSGSKNVVVRETLDKLSFQTSVSENITRNENILADTSFSQDFSLSYSNTVRWKPRLTPLAFAAEWFLVKKLSGLEIGYTPENLQLSANTRRNIRHRYDRNLTETHTQTYELTRKWSSSIKPINDFTISGGRDYYSNLMFNRDQVRLRDPVNPESDLYPAVQDFNARLEDWRAQSGTFFDQDYRIRQKADFSWNPKLLSWLDTRFTYNTTYDWSRELPTPAYGVNISNSGRFSADLELDGQKLIHRMIFMSDESFNSAKRELTALKEEREERRQERRDAREARREAKRLAKEAEKAGTEEAVTPDIEAPVDVPEEEEPVLQPVEAPGDRAIPFPGSPESRIVSAPQAPAEAPEEANEIVSRPVAMEDTLLAMLPDSLLAQIARADSIIAAQAAQAADSNAAEAADEVTEEKDHGELLEAIGKHARRTWQRFGVFVSKVDPIDIRFTRSTNRSDPGRAVYPWDDWQSWHANLMYQLALDPDPGIDPMMVTSQVVSLTRHFDYGLDLSTKLNFFQSVPIRLDYKTDFSQDFRDERESARSKNHTGWYVFEGDGLFSVKDAKEGAMVAGNPSTLDLPNYSFSLRNLQDIWKLDRWFKTLNMSHSYSGKADTRYSAGADGLYRSQLSLDKSFSPFAGFDFTLEKGWSGRLDYKIDRRLSVSDPDGAARRVSLNQTRGWTMSAQKRLKKGMKIPGFGKRLENETTLSVTYDNRRTLELNSTTTAGEEGNITVWNMPLTRKTWSIKFGAEYRFSKNVNGGASWQFEVEETSSANDRTSRNTVLVYARMDITGR